MSCMDAVDEAIRRRYEGDNLKGADHYLADYMPKYPYWSEKFKVVARVGRHIFYRS